MDCFAALAMTTWLLTLVMTGLVSDIQVFARKKVDARDKPGHEVVSVESERSNYAWLATALPSAACAAASRAIGTR
jgi:hypothetical protein